MSDANTQTETRPHVQAASSRSGTSLSAEAMQWVESIARLTQPQIVHWCTGSKRLRELMIRDGSLLPLNEQTHPGSFCARSDVNDVARVEGRTFICSRNESDAGPSNNWSDPVYMREFLSRLFDGCMRGRVMYVIPYLLGPPGSPLAQVGIEVTDSPYVVASMCVMTRVGRDAIDEFSRQSSFVRGLHSTGNLDPEQRYICHFPDENLIMSFSSNYGGNALLAKKCHALRLASVSARREGWLAEHMMVLGVTSPDGVTTYIAGAFPSSCGKTNLAMLVPPEADQQAGWKIETLGDDIAWLHSGPDGKLYAINPEAGFFGVAPGTSRATNPNALAALREDVLFTNVAVRQDGTVWWEGLDGEVPAACTDWTGQPWTPDSGRPAAH
ncbi:MAG: phosphoenolpyruvate carboxykinase (GTP), partial [Planctomycetota bacterium]